MYGEDLSDLILTRMLTILIKEIEDDNPIYCRGDKEEQARLVMEGSIILWERVRKEKRSGLEA